MGNDILLADWGASASGSDTIYGDGGNDRIDADTSSSSGQMRAIGGDGNDTIFAVGNDVYVEGNAGDDDITGIDDINGEAMVQTISIFCQYQQHTLHTQKAMQATIPSTAATTTTAFSVVPVMIC